jgi:hypothetical protein
MWRFCAQRWSIRSRSHRASNGVLRSSARSMMTTSPGRSPGSASRLRTPCSRAEKPRRKGSCRITVRSGLVCFTRLAKVDFPAPGGATTTVMPGLTRPRSRLSHWKADRQLASSPSVSDMIFILQRLALPRDVTAPCDLAANSTESACRQPGTPLEVTDHWFGWLPDTPGNAVRSRR